MRFTVDGFRRRMKMKYDSNILRIVQLIRELEDSDVPDSAKLNDIKFERSRGTITSGEAVDLVIEYDLHATKAE